MKSFIVEISLDGKTRSSIDITASDAEGAWHAAYAQQPGVYIHAIREA